MADSFLLLNDGSSQLLLNDGTSFLLLNEDVAPDTGVQLEGDYSYAGRVRKPTAWQQKQLTKTTSIDVYGRIRIPIITDVMARITRLSGRTTLSRVLVESLYDIKSRISKKSLHEFKSRVGILHTMDTAIMSISSHVQFKIEEEKKRIRKLKLEKIKRMIREFKND